MDSSSNLPQSNHLIALTEFPSNPSESPPPNKKPRSEGTSRSSYAPRVDSPPSPWETLSGPPFELICSFLHWYRSCKDLANVSHYYRNAVEEFLKRPANRPGVHRVSLEKEGDNMCVDITFSDSYLSFHDLILRGLDWGRFERVNFNGPTLKVKICLRGDPLFGQVRDLLSTFIKYVGIDFNGTETHPTVVMLCDLLDVTTIRQLQMEDAILDDTTDLLIISIVNRASSIVMTLEDASHLSDPEAFIAEVYETSSWASLGCSNSPSFGLTKSFWETFLNEKFRTGSLDHVLMSNLPSEGATEAPIVLDGECITFIEWSKVRAE